ncbi:hypothetical protein [Negadavirga shengliensis]|uniref:Uncharacterized protein n=1 Tax=Negadavirga shengliensis TaxID=1389218 RepID=A0ABV9T3B6_9BACT
MKWKKEKRDNGQFTDNAFEKAQALASEGKSGPEGEKGAESIASEKARDDLFRAKEADKEWSSESDQYRRDNA